MCQSVFISAYCSLVTFSGGSGNDELTVPSLHVQSIMHNYDVNEADQAKRI